MVSLTIIVEIILFSLDCIIDRLSRQSRRAAVAEIHRMNWIPGAKARYNYPRPPEASPSPNHVYHKDPRPPGLSATLVFLYVLSIGIQIFDSRGNPTVEVDVHTAKGLVICDQ